MAGFENDIMFAKNADFSQADNQVVSESNGLISDGQLWIGRTATNAGGTHIDVGTLTAGTGITITNGPGSITIGLAGGGLAIDSIAMQTGTTPVVPDAAGLWTFNGAVVAAGTNPVRTHGTGANTTALEVQVSQALAASDATKIGLSNFDSASFAVDANGFVTLSATGAGKTITGDSGGALSPTANNWNILGRSGSKTSGSGSTLTINSPPYSDQGGSTTVTLNSGSFATAAITLTTPATAGLLDGDLLEFVATNGVLVIQLASTQVAHLGNVATTAAGTLTSSATGDAICLRYQASTNDWWATSSIGIWTLA